MAFFNSFNIYIEGIKMKLIIMKIILFLFIDLMFVARIYANDASGAILPTGEVQFINRDGIKMEVEALFIKPTIGKYGHPSNAIVEVNYIFENVGNEDIMTEVFFPLPEMDAVDDGYGSYSDEAHNFDFKVWIDGVPIENKEHFQLIYNEADVTKFFKPLFKEYYYVADQMELNKYIQSLPAKYKKYLIDNKIIIKGFINDEIEGWIINDRDIRLKRKIYFYWEQNFPAHKRVHIKHTYIASSFSTNVGSAMINYGEKNFSTEEYKKIKIPETTISNKDELYDYYYHGYFKYILVTANNWNKPIRAFNLLVEGKEKALTNFEGELKLSDDNFLSLNITNFSPTKDMYIEFINKYRDFSSLYKERYGKDYYSLPKEIKDSTETYKAKEEIDKEINEAEKRHTYSNAKLYRIDGPANIRKTPNGEIIVSLENGVCVWVVETKSDGWSRIIYNDLRGWTYKKNLIDIWDVKKH
jgi:hypothetical protein